ncbi:FAD binding domain-containing protein [Pigmentiphaga litoralis]|uniref:FAD binding domain-containing protein n=1 Tax=Pigmentiphaga litoralis TaxID=516702 RepID=UPI003B42F7C0
MKAALFDYTRPDEVGAALSALTGSPGAKAMGGSQSLGPMLNLRLARPGVVVDVSGIAGLRTVTKDGDSIRVGAAVTHAEIEDGVHPLLRGTPLQKIAAGIAYRSVRNRGTLGGSLAHADPAADWLVTAVAFEASLEIVSSAGSRRVDADAFMIGAYTTVLAENELIAAVRFPVASPAMRWGYYKYCRKTGEFAEASCAARFDSSTGMARIAIGALSGAPRLLPALAAAVAREGQTACTNEAIAHAVAEAMPDHDAVDRKLHAVAVRRCLAQLLGAEESTWR